MLWMQTYLFYCSVRLGVIVIACLTLLQQLAPAVLLLIFGMEILEPLLALFRNDDYYGKNKLVHTFLSWVEQHPEDFIVILNILFFNQIATCILAMFGAFKLKKFLLLPLIVIEFVRVIICLTGHIILMIVLKKLINLGVLVAFTLLGGFLILYLAYNWCACVALYQIINLINGKRYRALYGDDPFSPKVTAYASAYNNQYPSYNTIENVHVLSTPNGSDVDAIKQKNYEAQQRGVEQQMQQQHNHSIIAVLPANYQLHQLPINAGGGDSRRFKQRNRKWWQNTKMKAVVGEKSGAGAAAPKAPISTFTQKQTKLENDYTVDYGHWQWSEILAPNAKKRNMLLGANYRY